jgi:glycosyltransferase involved in cell wall biosynthesis
MEQEKISVILPVYNVEQAVEMSVQSVLNQTYRNLEVILVDDGSTDHSGAICDTIAGMDSRVVVVHQNHAGPSGSRNVGIEKATGSYIAFIDSDDYVLPGMLETLYANLQKSDADVSMCEFERVPEEEIAHLSPKAKQTGEQRLVLFEKEQLFPLLFHNSFKNKSTLVVVWNKLYRAEVFESIRFPDGHIHEDEYIIHHVLDRIDRMVYTEAVYYEYVQHTNGIMGHYNEQRIWDALYAYEDRAKLFAERGQQDYYRLSVKEWLYYAKKSYMECQAQALPEYRSIQKHLKKEIRSKLAVMKQNHCISGTSYRKHLIWTYIRK